ncbi:hypothetical protein [Phytomonospora endophytica]|uniref:Uncharacterized protein n=1 Tax=Phytomonospora endophytica TaxID=714109 RepID=A0A841FK06_9ACTN|nr:hypothetical protein [Phytomonospora endophytica]MBB6035273.1 hypothetical protein [Phytomonospora endophytica]
MAVVAAVATPFAIVWRMSLACVDDVAAEEAEVRVDHAFTTTDITEVGGYTSVRWTVDYIGGCAAARKPRAVIYRALFTLDEATTEALARDHFWLPLTPITVEGPADADAIGPELLSYVPAGTRWSMSTDLSVTDLGSYTGSLFFDAEHALAYARFW